MSYVDGYVTPVPNANKEAYLELSREVGGAFKAHGATAWVLCWQDEVPEGVKTSFTKAVELAPDESVCFAWITWPSKEVRTKAIADMQKEWAETGEDPPNLFDQSRMIVGSFDLVLEG